MGIPRKIAIIDDDFIFHFTSRHLFEKAFPGVQVLTYKSCEEGLVGLNSEEPDVLLLDINIPEMSGWELLDELFEKQGKIAYPIFVISSSIDPDDKRRADKHALKPIFLEKPLTMEKIQQLADVLA